MLAPCYNVLITAQCYNMIIIAPCYNVTIIALCYNMLIIAPCYNVLSELPPQPLLEDSESRNIVDLKSGLLGEHVISTDGCYDGNDDLKTDRSVPVRSNTEAVPLSAAKCNGKISR